MKAILLALLSTQALANTVYVGDYSLYDSNTFNNVIVDRNPRNILSTLKNLDYSNIDHVILSTGVSNSCSSYKIAEEQIKYLVSQNVKFIVIKNNSCMGVDSVLRRSCNAQKNCTYKELSELKR